MGKLSSTIIIFLVIISAVFWTHQIALANYEINIPMAATQNKAILLSESANNISFPVLIDSAEKVWLIFVSNVQTLQITLTTPNNALISKENIDTIGGIYIQYTSNSSSSLINPLMIASGGTKYIFEIQNPVSGEWSINITDPNLQQEAGVFFTYIAKSEIVANVVTNKKEYKPGETIVAAAIVNEGDEPYIGANVVSHFAGPSVDTSLVMRDDGANYDIKANDGIYTATLNASEPGEFTIDTEISGVYLSESFVRHVGTNYYINEELANFMGDWSDNGIDIDNDGFFDKIQIGTGVNVVKTGNYNFKLIIDNQNGNPISISKIQEFSNSGVNIAYIDVLAQQLRSLNSDGPYIISKAILEYLADTRDKLADEVNNAHQTKQYLLTQLERPDIFLTGTFLDYATDSDGDSLINSLTIEMQVEVNIGGIYQWSGRLTDKDKKEIDFSSNSKQLNVGTNTIELTFDGCKIGENGSDGPFILNGFLIFGAGNSLIANNVVSTQAYELSNFECVTQNSSPITDAGMDQNIEVGEGCEATVTLDGSGSYDPDGDPLAHTWTNSFGSINGESPNVVLGIGIHTVTLTVNDGNGGISTDTVDITIKDSTPPVTQIQFPEPNLSLQDGISFSSQATDHCFVEELYFYIREQDGNNGKFIGYDDLSATYNTASTSWEYPFNTTNLPDGHYLVLSKAIDKNGNEGWSIAVPFSIRNWAIIELFPASDKYRAGRTMPVKFSLRIAKSVDTTQPFVYTENLELKIYEQAKSGAILKQTSIFGDTHTDYRINTDSEHYITNFKTSKKPGEYLVEIWRPSNNFLVGDFSFKTDSE